MPLRRLHDSAVKNLTPEQLTIARFWANLSGPGHSLAIASQIPVQESANLETAAETYARVGIAVADAVTAVWHAKYTDNLLRSRTSEKPSIRCGLPRFQRRVFLNPFQRIRVSPLLQQQRWSTFSVRTSHSSMMAGDADGFSRIDGGIHFQHGNLDGQAQGAALRAIVDAVDWRR